MYELKDRLKEALIYRKMSAAELARQSGIDKGSISNYLKGKFVPKQNAIGSMARALGISPAWLMGYDVPIEKEEIDLSKLNEGNQLKLKAYYDALIDSQNGNT